MTGAEPGAGPTWGRVRRGILISSVALVMSSALVAGPAHADTPPSSPAGDVNSQLGELNTDFRQWYADRRAQIMADQPLILVVNNGGVTAIRRGQTARYAVDLTAYTQVKSVLHAVLGYQSLMRSTIRAGAAADWTKVATLIGELQQARALIPQTLIPVHLQPGVIGAYDTLIASAQQALAGQSITLSQERAALGSAKEGIYPAVLWIGRAHARNMKSVLQTVKGSVPAQDWRRAVAVVTGPMTPRRDNLETAVTARMLGPEKLGVRIFYSENLFSTTDALNYLGTVIGDSQFSQDMFDSTTRMWRDLFADVSAEYVARDFYTALAQ